MRPTAALTAAAAALAVAVAAWGDPPARSPDPGGLNGTRLFPVDARDAQVRSAQAQAMVQLRAKVLHLAIGRRLSVGDLVAATDSSERLDQALSNARQLGTPRWPDEQTCQVQVTVPGAAVADAVSAMAARYPGGLPARDLQASLAGWRRTAYSADGSSVAGGRIGDIHPDRRSGRWATVPDATVTATISAAQADAVRQLDEAVTRAAGRLPLGAGGTAAAALARRPVAGQVHAFLQGRSLGKIDFMDDLSIAVTVPVDRGALADAVQQAVTDDQPRVAADARRRNQWEPLRSAIERGVPPSVIGTASAVGGVGRPDGGLPLVVLDIRPPDEFDGTLEADGVATADPHGPVRPLKVRQAAEDDAATKIRRRLLSLHVNRTTTLAEAARADPQLAALVSKVMLDVKSYDVSSSADGSTVRVRSSLNLREAWEKLRTGP